MPRSDQCDGYHVKENFYRFDKKYWINTMSSSSLNVLSMQSACEKHNASLFPINSRESFQRTRAISSESKKKFVSIHTQFNTFFSGTDLLNNGESGMIVGLINEPGNQTWIDGTPFKDTRDVFTEGVDLDKAGSIVAIFRSGKLESTNRANMGVCGSDCPRGDPVPGLVECSLSKPLNEKVNLSSVFGSRAVNE